MNIRRCVNFVLLVSVWAALVLSAAAQGTKRIVIIKVDGLPGYYVDRFVKQRDPETGRSMLPWIEQAFYKNGTRLENFYTRGMSLSGPSWGMLDTGQHLQIKGNVEYDRYTLEPYDYLNFIPYYNDYRKHDVADMPAVEVMDQIRVPLLIDAFPIEKRFTAQQLYQRGNSWEVIGKGFVNMYPGDAGDFMDEWTIGLNFRKASVDQVEKEIVKGVAGSPDIDYFDYYDTSFDHISHHTSDTASRLNELKALDRTIGRIWSAIQSSPRADETAMVLVSDHGFNAEDKVYSQGFNLVKLLASPAGGGHHVVTKRRLMLDYSVKGLYPLTPIVKTASQNSYYLKGRQGDYPTVLLDFDGNERSSIHLRNSDLNVMQILIQQMQRSDVDPRIRQAAQREFFRIRDADRAVWTEVVSGLNEELAALSRSVEKQRTALKSLPADSPETAKIPGFDQQKARLKALLRLDENAVKDYQAYLRTLNALLDLRADRFDPKQAKVEDLIAPGAMGESNSLYQLQNYVVGPSPSGLVLTSVGELDRDKSFIRVNYFELLHAQAVKSNTQEKVSNRPIDFVAVRLPAEGFSSTQLAGEIKEDPIWIFSSDDSQALLLSRTVPDGSVSYRYVPVSGLASDDQGKISFRTETARAGLPLHFFEDANLAVGSEDRTTWLTGWHTEREWLLATHRTKYSNAVIGLNEQLGRHPVVPAAETEDEKLIRRFRLRQRHLTEADMLILANDHWNFDVRGFNPGGNHGSFFRVSTNSTLMFAGGPATGIARGLTVTEPYDSLNLVPTILSLMGKANGRQPSLELQKKGFMRFPGDPIPEVMGKGK